MLRCYQSPLKVVGVFVHFRCPSFFIPQILFIMGEYWILPRQNGYHIRTATAEDDSTITEIGSCPVAFFPRAKMAQDSYDNLFLSFLFIVSEKYWNRRFPLEKIF
jgi:hypothetical protein